MALFSADFGRRIRRVVQRADQNFGRAEKSEVLTDEIQGMEKLIDLIRLSFQGTLKRFQACLPPVADPDKRLRKLPESMLSLTLNESASQLNQSPLFSKTFTHFGEAEQHLADALLNFTVEVEKAFLQPLVTIVDKDIPAILKLRKQLTNMALDMDSAKKAMSALQKQAQVPPGRIDSAREELEAEEIKVDQCRDQLLTEMYQFFAREEKLCKLLLLALQLQADYHRQALRSLEKQISEMSEEIDQNSAKPVYGCDLQEHLLYTKQEIATVIGVCVQSIQRLGLDAEGLFRIAPSTSKLRKLTAAFDANIVDDDFDDVDVHCLAGALKLYLRELPNPLMTFELYNDWSNAAQKEGSDRIDALLSIVKKLPKSNYNNLRYLVRFLSNITKYSDVNKMSSTNLAIVIAPNLLYPSKAEQGSMQVAGVAMAVVEPLISQCDIFFPVDNSGLQPSTSVNQVDENKAHTTAEAGSKLSPNQRNKKVFGEKPKKSLAPAPPVVKQRSESAPDYGNIPNYNDNAFENPNAVLNSESKSKQTNKLTPPPKKAIKSADAEYADDTLRNSSGGNLADADHVPVVIGVNEEQEESSMPGHKRLQRSRALDDVIDDENKPSDDEVCNSYEVFTPVNLSPESNVKTHSPRLVQERKGSCSGLPAGLALMTEKSPTVGSSNFSGTTAATTVKDDAYQKQNTKDMAKASSIMQHFRNKSSGGELSMTSSSSSSSLSTSFMNFNKNRNLEIKSATLPADKVSLCQIRFKSQDGSDEETRPLATETVEVKQKPRPKVPPRSPVRDKKHQDVVLEDTHL